MEANAEKPKKLLLIGHGYLGRAVARKFRDAGWEVVPVSLSGGEGAIACDVSDREQVAVLPEADGIVHCAASGRGGAEAYQRVYVDGCRNLVERFPRVPLLFTSSTSVYAQTDGGEVTEEKPGAARKADREAAAGGGAGGAGRGWHGGPPVRDLRAG